MSERDSRSFGHVLADVNKTMDLTPGELQAIAADIRALAGGCERPRPSDLTNPAAAADYAYGCEQCGRPWSEHGLRNASHPLPSEPDLAALREALELLRWRHPRRHTVAPHANEAENRCVHSNRGPMCDLCRGAIDRWNREEAALAAANPTPEPARDDVCEVFGCGQPPEGPEHVGRKATHPFRAALPGEALRTALARLDAILNDELVTFEDPSDGSRSILTAENYRLLEEAQDIAAAPLGYQGDDR